MSLEEIYYLSQIIAATALVASLIFVALQLRQNTSQMKSSQLATQITLEAAGQQMDHGTFLALATDETLCEIAARGRASLAGLTQSERRRFGHYMMAIMGHAQFGYLVYCEGASSDDVWRGNAGTLAPLIRSPGACDWWRRHRLNFLPAYRAWIDGLAGNGPLMPPGLPEGHPFAAPTVTNDQGAGQQN